MAFEKDWVLLNVNVKMTADALQAIVANAKKKAGADENGVFHIDTADKVSELISRFLLENDFEAFAHNFDNY